MKQFTVILMYPDYHANQYGETWCAPVKAPNAAEAVTVAQKTCARDSGIERPEDLLPVSVFAGDHPDLINQWVEAQNNRATV